MTERKENAFNNTLNTYLQLDGIEHMVKDRSDSKIGNLLLPLYGLVLPISSKGYFISISPQTG